MANIKISDLTALTPPDAADLVPVTDSSASQTKRTTVGEIVGIVSGDVDVANDGTATISELPVSKLQDGAARQLLQTNAAGTGVEWTSNVDLPGTLDVTGAATFDEHINLASAKEYRISGTKVLDATSLGSAVVSSSLTSVGTIGTGVWQGTAIDAAYLDSTLVTTGDTGTVTSTMLADGTIVDADVNAAAAIAGSKIDPDFGSQTVSSEHLTVASSGSTSETVAEFGNSVVGDGLQVTTNGNLEWGFNALNSRSLTFSTNQQERARLDASGRLLTGATSSSVSTRVVVQGHSGSSVQDGRIYIQRGATSLGSNTRLSQLSFADSAGNVGASIEAWSETAWAASDYPGRLLFLVTEDGAASPTEAMRIKNSKIVNLSNAPTYADNAAARAGGLVAGDVYRKSDGTLMITY